jgi:ZIP family zinc transporter/zinc and cadmium transporter
MNAVSLSLVLGLSAAMANVVGGAVVAHRRWEQHYLKYFVALGAGFMLGTALAEMVPESVELKGHNAGVLVLAGYLLVHFFEHSITPHFHFGEETHPTEFAARRTGYSVLFALLVHTFFDGIAIASGFLVSNWLGWIIFLAVFLHKVPEGFTVASVMLASGQTRGTAWIASILLGAATVAGVLTMTVTQQAVGVGLPLSAGVTIYVAASDLMPEINKEPGVKMSLIVFLGVGSLFLLDRLLHAH